MAQAHSLLGRIVSHYRILEKIGAGGMGEVYRAHDEQLDRDVALKVLPAGMIADEDARKRFRKEALALARLNHPNIETVFEFSSQDGLDFLAMELIPGHPLSEQIIEGPLAEKEVLRLGVQFAEGLAAAHDKGIIHRDLKPANLFVTPDGRLKILDFGLAKLRNPVLDVDLTRSIATEGQVSGTIPYMSPEQLRGLPVDPRSDIYAAGAVLYEMATGRRPFPQTQGAELMGAILHQDPQAPRSLNAQISPGFDAVLRKGLEKDAAHRFQSSRELRAVLETLASGAPWANVASAPRPAEAVSAPPALVRWGIAMAIAVILAFGTAVGFNLGGLRNRFFRRGAVRNATPGSSAAPIRARRSVAVLGFKNVSGRQDEAWLSTALSEMLTTELAAGEQLRTVPGENVAQMKINLSLPDADSYGKETLERIHRNLNADDVVLGSYVPLGKGQIRLDLRLQDAVQGETLASVSKKGSEDQIDELVSSAGAELREKLGAAAVSKEEAAAVRASTATNPRAAQLYSQGLAKLRQFDSKGAKDLLEQAVAIEPNYALAHSALAGAFSQMGDDLMAKDEAKKALDLSANLSREDRLSIEGRYRELANDRDQAVKIYQTLFNFFPDSLDYGLRLARAQEDNGQLKDALFTLQSLRKLPAPLRDDPRIDLAQAQALESVFDFKAALAATEAAGAKATAQGARRVVAEAFFIQSDVLRQMGQPQQALAATQQGSLIYSETGDRIGAASSFYQMGAIFWTEGNLPEAKKAFEQSLELYLEIGYRKGAASSLNNIGKILMNQGDLPGAEKMLLQSLVIKRAINNKIGTANVLDDIGALKIQEGNLPAAREFFGQAMEIRRQAGDQDSVAYSMRLIAGVLQQQGHLFEARKMYEDAAQTFEKLDDQDSLAFLRSDLGGLLTLQGDLPRARETLKKALASFQKSEEKGSAASCRLGLGEVSLAEEKPGDAESAARDAIAEFEAEKSSNAAYAYDLLARVQLAQAKVSDAHSSIRQAAALAEKARSYLLSASVAITAARVQAVSGNSPSIAPALRSLQDVAAKAEKLGDVTSLMEARLALCEIQIKSGNAAAGRARLATLEKDATAKGFLLIARKAHAAATTAVTTAK